MTFGMLRTSIDDGESDNEEYRKIRREIATSSDMTEQQQLLRGPKDIDSEFGKEGDHDMRQQEQLQQEREMINELARTGVIFAYEKALLAAAKKKDLRATELLEFVAKKIENFGRQWESGYINKERYLSPSRRPAYSNTNQDNYYNPSEVQTNDEDFDIKINQDEWEGDIAEAWPSPTSQSFGSAEGGKELEGEDDDKNDRTPTGITKLQAIQRGIQGRNRVKEMHRVATKMQSLFRGYQNRKLKLDLEATRKAKEELEAEKAKLAEEAAALAAEKQALLEAQQKFEEEKRAIEEKNRQNAAAAQIQKWSRGILARQRVKQMQLAATKMQALARGFAARKLAKERKEKDAAPPVVLNKKPKGKKKKVYKSKNKLPLSKVKDYIAGMYEKKAKADVVDDKKGNERDTLEEFCDDFFSQMFGMPALAGKKRYELEQGVKRFQKDDDFVKWFGTLIGWLDDDVHEDMHSPFREEAIDAYLYLMVGVFPVDSIEELLDDDPCLIKFVDVKNVAEKLFKKQIGDEKFKDTLAKIEETEEDDEVEFDDTFDLLMRLWYSYDTPIICPKAKKEEAPKGKEEKQPQRRRGRRKGRGKR